MKLFDTIILEEADNFIKKFDEKVVKKIFFVIRSAEQHKDPKLFKKLSDNIWEFRVRHQSKKIRLLAFWDKSKKTNTLVLATNGFIKKTQKTPIKEIKKAEGLRKKYFENKD